MSAPRVFISYSHESPEHQQRVLELAARLRGDGIDAWLDLYSPPPAEGWAVWIERQHSAAHWIILVCTETYGRRFNLIDEADRGRGVAYEGLLTRADLYDDKHNLRAIPVVFAAADVQHIPRPLASSSRYVIADDYAELLRHIAGVPEVEAPPLGEPMRDAELRPAGLSVPEVQSTGLPDQPAPAADRSAIPPELIRVETRRAGRRASRILIVAACPQDRSRLALGREIREIGLALRRAPPGRYETQVLWAATENDFRREMLRMEPEILHFCGHGTTGGIALEQDSGHTDLVDGEALVHWLSVAISGQKRPLQLAVLNFCYSQAMLSSLSRTANVVVGPTQHVKDSAAVIFSAAFYMGLAAGGTGVFSYHLGCSAIEMSGVVSSQDVDTYGIRCRSAAGAVIAQPTAGARKRPLSLTFFVSEPQLATRIRADRELRAILSVVSPKVLCVEQRWATRVNDFLQALLETRPMIVHLTGPGNSNGEFLFEADQDPAGCSAPSKAVAKALSLFHADIKCTVLMFDHSSVLADQLTDVFDHVISVSGGVTDDSCRLFSEAFYQMLVARGSFPDAYSAAVTTLRGKKRTDADLFSIRGRSLRRLTASKALPKTGDY